MNTTLSIAPPRFRLIINADDLGVSPERDAGIFECFNAGSISSASLLVDGADAESAAKTAVELDLPLGLHLNLTEYALASPCSLTSSEGIRLGKRGLREALAAGSVRDADIIAEIRRQFDRFIAMTGELPSHVDGHHHIHVEPAVATSLARIMAREYGVYCIRLPRERGLQGLTGDADFDAPFQRAVAIATEATAPLFAAHGIYGTDAFLGQSMMGLRLQPGVLRRALTALAESAAHSVELMVHPGLSANAPSRGEFCRSPARSHERLTLQQAACQQAIEGWSLGSYRDLPRHDEGSQPTILIYGKLTPATGNAESARRYEAAWSTQANIRFRTLVPIDSPAALSREVCRLRELSVREHLDFAFGIHLYRAGVPLANAFAAADAPPLPYGLLASGTDINADILIPERGEAISDAVRHADFLLCLTDDARQRLEKLPLPAATFVQPNGIEVGTASRFSLRTALHLDAATSLILLPAALRRLKGILPTIDALAPLLATRYSRHVLAVVGPVLEPDYAAELRTRIDQLAIVYPGLAGRIVLHPGLAHDDYLAALRETALVLNSSDHEGLSHALAEAMAIGIPVLARDIPGNRALIRDDETGRLFAGFSELPARYTTCFDDRGATAEMAAAARREVAERFPADREREHLRNIAYGLLDRHQVRIGNLRVEIAPGTHPVSVENLALFDRISVSTSLPTTIPLACDVGCGCGVFGLQLLQALSRDGRRVRQMLFSDVHQPSLSALARTLIRHASEPGMPETATLDAGSLLEPVRRRGEKATLICANLPQTPGPQGFRLDRCGGSDGADLICAFLSGLPHALAETGEAFLLHIGLAHPARVKATISAIGFMATELATQTRLARFADYDDLHPGLADYLRSERAAGRAEFEVDADGKHFRFHTCLLRLRRAAG